MPIVVEEIY